MINYNDSLSFRDLLDKVKTTSSILIDSVNEAEIASVITYIEKTLKKNILIISTDRKKDLLYKNLSSFSENLLEFISWETLFFEDIKPSSDIVGKRFEVLYKLLSNKPYTLICTLHSVLQKVLPPKNLEDLYLKIEVNQNFDFDKFIEKLFSFGYTKESIVSDKAQFAVRGGIVDVFPVNQELPYRIDFFSDEIESIRTFDLATQKSIEKKNSTEIFIADEMKFLKTQDNLTSVLSYLKDDYIVIFDDLFQIEENMVCLNIKPSKYFLSFDDLLNSLKISKKIYFSENQISSLSEVTRLEKQKYFQKITFKIFKKTFESFLWHHPFTTYNDFLQKDKIENILDYLDIFIEKKLKILFLISNHAEKKHLFEILEKKGFKNLDIFLFEDGFLSKGFIISDLHLCVIPYIEITHRKVIRRQKFRESYQTPFSEYHDLEIGDLVVHYHSGIGKYLGCETHSNHLGIETEFLIIEYEKNSKLYVPISQAHLISKYIGAKDEKPHLSQLGSSKWQKTKHLAQKQIIGYASDLLAIQAQRELEGGHQFPKDSEDTNIFELEFPYQETKDQLTAIEEIKQDMTSKKAMDRLLCGDVGYGKTEVAMRAAFKTVYDGKKQVAVLVPTTVLAMQHYDSFKERTSSFPINIEVVSRFNKAKQNKQILENTKKGLVDILIGTHRLLSKDVLFSDLGLIIIDEEQRFGVRAKEHLKKLKKEVDCLTLSATPLPRTLYMSLIKIKDISVINTPPQDRLPIKTIIAENEDSLIKTAILRELSRQGQIFFIHNRVESIYKRKEHIEKLIPNARIAVVHGQMATQQVDKIFHDFKKGDIDILFATTIVENGVDVPNANTIIIDRADSFGLADLYQLRGRVGRWNRASYAYFLIPQRKQINEISQKRLNALLEAPGYGGGMKIAMRDLEIRGAGDILGVKQSGQISNIGFHLYCKLLKKAILSFKNKKEISFIETKIEFPYPAFLPESYIQYENLRMEIYYRLGEINSFNLVDKVEEELIDRFGNLPQEVVELLSLTKIRIFANQNNFLSLKFSNLTLRAERQTKTKKIQKTLMLPKKINPLDFKDKVINLLKDSFEI